MHLHREQQLFRLQVPALGTLTISPSGAPVNGVQNISITARTADTTIPSGCPACDTEWYWVHHHNCNGS